MANIEPDMSGCYRGESETHQSSYRDSIPYNKSPDRNVFQQGANSRKVDISEEIKQSKLLSKSYLHHKIDSEQSSTMINKSEIGTLLNQTEKNYSKLLKFVIERLLDPNPDTRLDLVALY